MLNLFYYVYGFTKIQFLQCKDKKDSIAFEKTMAKFMKNSFTYVKEDQSIQYFLLDKIDQHFLF